LIPDTFAIHGSHQDQPPTAERTIKRFLAVGCDLNKNRAVSVDFEIHISVYQRSSAVGLLYQRLSAFISVHQRSDCFISVYQRSDL
jgi:hypothetical protein